MKAAYIREHGGPEKLEHGDLPEPKPKPDEVLVKVKACALNHLDIWVRNGSPAYKIHLPHVLGSDISGEIAELPSEIHPQVTAGGEALSSFRAFNLKVGSPVFVAPGISCWNCSECLSGHDSQCDSFHIVGAKKHGGYAEYVAVPSRNVFPKPEHLSFEEAASFPLTFLTAWHMLVTRAGIKPGEKVLILGAGSGIGTAAIQIAKVCGGVVFAVSSTEEKLAHARELGADETINGQNEDFSISVRKLTGGRGVDIVFEHVGPATWDKSVRSLAPRGRIVTCGATTGPTVSLDLRYFYMKDFSLFGSRLGTIAELEKILALIQRRRLKPVVSKIFPLSEARLAHEFLERKEQFGKVILTVS